MWDEILNFCIKLSIWNFQRTEYKIILEFPNKSNSLLEIPLTKLAQKVSNDLLEFLKFYPQCIWLDFQMLHQEEI